MRRIARRIVLACLVALAAAYPVYYLAANAWIRPGGGLDRLLNRRPNFLLIKWKSAHTSWPGIVSVEGFSLRSQVSTVQWWVALDKGRATIDLPALRRREFRLLGLSGTGVDFRLARRLDARLRRRPDPAFQPAIPGLSNPPRPAEIPQRRAGARRKREPWRIELAGVALDGVREVWIEEYRFAGDAEVAGGFDLRVRRRLTVAPTTVRVRGGALRRGARAILDGARGTVRGRILELDPRRVKGRQVLGFTIGRAAVAGQVGDLAVLRELVQGARWVELRGGGGPITADLRLDRGRFAAGSRLEARPRGVGIGFLDYAASGRGSVVWSVEPGKTELSGRLVVDFDEYEVRRDGAARPHLKGRELRLSATSAAPRADRLFAPIAIDLQMPDAAIQDLAFYNSYLPASSGLRLRGGSGQLSGKFRAAAPGWVGTGEVLLIGRRIAAELDGRRLTGDLRLDARLGHADVRERVFDLAGSRLEVTGVTIAGPAALAAAGSPAAPGWWGRFHVDRGRLMPGRKVFLTAQVEAMLRDPKPLIALFAPARQGWVVRRAVRLLDVQGVGATADVRLGEELVEVDRLAVAGGPAELRGRLRFAGAARDGVLLARYGRLSFGMELAGGERQLHLLRARKWFEGQMTEGAAGGGR
jgi:hypothetical protein